MDLLRRILSRFRKAPPPEPPKPSYEYISDEPDYRHLDDRERFKALYEEVGTVEANLRVEWREEWMGPFSPEGGAVILELGAHNGPNLIHYARLGHEVDGVEISESLIRTFERHREQEPPEVRARMRIFPGWIEEFAPPRLYDWVVCAEVLEHVADPVAILRVASACLKEGGTAYVTSPSTLWGNNTHVRAVPPSDLSGWLAGAGLVPVRMYEENGRTFCWARKG